MAGIALLVAGIVLLKAGVAGWAAEAAEPEPRQ
jgi:hypothetical protein